MFRILVIDDESQFAKLILEILGEEGYAADSAPDGASGLAKVLADPPDLVLCDLHMRGASGRDVLAALRAERRTAAVPLIFLTGMGTGDASGAGAYLGADGYLAKPVSAHVLLDAVRNCLERWRSQLWIDARDTITAVDEAWLDFARGNGAPELTRAAVLGHPLREFVTESEAIGLDDLLAAVRAQPSALVLPFRCDAPDKRRFMRMTLQPEPGGGVRIEYRLLRDEPRAPVALLDRAASRSQAHADVCSWCRRVRAGADWREADDAAVAAVISDPGGRPPQVSHRICPACATQLRVSIRAGTPPA